MLKRLLLVLLVLVIGFAAARATTPSGLVPRTAPPRAELPPESTGEDFLTLEDIVVFDLRKFRPVHWWNGWYRSSPMDMTDTLYVRRLGARSNYVLHFATTGLAIDLQCQGAPCTIVQRPDTGPRQDPGMKEYAMTVDLSGIPVGTDTLLVVQGTYWNGMRPDTAAVDTYTTDDIAKMSRLEVHAILPDHKPAKNPRIYAEPSGRPGTGQAYLPITDLNIGNGGHALFWRVSNRAPNVHYQLVWNW